MDENTLNNKDNYIPRPKEYWAKLSEYEGPLDILLHFVREDELNIYDIPISKITRDFLEYINYMQSLDIDLAGEFLLMAAELMKIKARMLIPQVTEEGEIIEEDPRLILVKKLIEYKRFKDISADLSNFENEARKRFFRTYFEKDIREYEHNITEDKSLKNLTIFNLIKAYRDTISSMKKEIIHPIELLDFTSEMQKDYIIEFFKENIISDFDKLVLPFKEKLRIVCTLIAILELTLEGYLKIIVDKEDISKFSITKREYLESMN